MTALAVCILLGSAAFTQSSQTAQSTCPIEDNIVPKHFHGVPPAIELKLRTYVAPDYPAAARRAQVQGRVVIQARISESGKVENPQVLSAPPLLRDAALAAVRRWCYEPACLKVAPVAVDYLIQINFSLKDGVTVD
ncbi:MAG: energy transducer TonB [Terriglobales bacterium]|jgi:TonB family protein